MPDDYAIAAVAAQGILDEDVKIFVPPLFQGRIPPGTTAKTAQEIAHAVVDALAKAHAASPRPGDA